ncbi:MAG: hypothetical protein IPO90_07060 [Flavobacteriales bacterium]|nr:hypothetical protein [Flavobacteriales bacterium]
MAGLLALVHLGETVCPGKWSSICLVVDGSQNPYSCLLLALVLGGLREFLFVNLNYQLDHVARRTEVSFAHSIFQGWTNDWSVGGLTVLKWIMAGAFTASMCFLCVWLARVFHFAPRHFDRWILLPTVVGLLPFCCIWAHVGSPPVGGGFREAAPRASISRRSDVLVGSFQP